MRREIINPGIRPSQISRGVAYGLWGLALFFALLIPIFLVHGFPLPLLEETSFRVKSLRRPFELSFIFFLLGLAFHPHRLRRGMPQLLPDEWREPLYAFSGPREGGPASPSFGHPRRRLGPDPNH